MLTGESEVHVCGGLGADDDPVSSCFSKNIEEGERSSEDVAVEGRLELIDARNDAFAVESRPGEFWITGEHDLRQFPSGAIYC